MRAAFFAAAERCAAPFVLTALRAAAGRAEAGLLAATWYACLASAFRETVLRGSSSSAFVAARERAGETLRALDF